MMQTWKRTSISHLSPCTSSSRSSQRQQQAASAPCFRTLAPAAMATVLHQQLSGPLEGPPWCVLVLSCSCGGQERGGVQQAEQAAEICSQLSHRLSAGRGAEEVGFSNWRKCFFGIVNAWYLSLKMVLSSYLVRSDIARISFLVLMWLIWTCLLTCLPARQAAPTSLAPVTPCCLPTQHPHTGCPGGRSHTPCP